MSRKPVVTIVDDDQSIREALNDLALSCGYQSRLYSSAEAFLAERDIVAVDCMLVDVKMPGMSGIELQAVLNDRPAPKPPMIFMTSYRDERTRAAVMSGGAFEFLSKPVDFARLIICLEQAIQRSRAFPD